MDEVSVLVPSKIGRADKIKNVILGPGPMSLDEFIAVVRYDAKVEFSPQYMERVSASRALAEKFLSENRKIYGLTTGFGENVNLSLIHI